MSLFGVFAALLGLFFARFAFVHTSSQRVVVFVLAYLMHVGMSLFYYSLVVDTGADALLYYNDALRIFGGGFSFGTVFLVYFTQSIKLVFGGTYLDHFLLFQALGFIGLVALMRSFEEIYESVGIPQPNQIYWLLFIPGLHYWSSAIGKDSLFFAAVCLALWASLRFKQRLLVMIFAVLLMGLIRPHIAAITLAALAFTVLTDRTTNVVLRVLFAGAATLGAAYAIATISGTYQVNLASAEGISNQLAGREALMSNTEAVGNTAVNAIYPLRVLSLLFRPLFFDATNPLAIIVSIENGFLVLIVASFFKHPRVTWQLLKTVPFFRFALLSSVGALLALSLTYYNVGLGIRQKSTMILPGILIGYATFRAVLLVRAQKEKLATLAAGQASLIRAGTPGEALALKGNTSFGVR